VLFGATLYKSVKCILIFNGVVDEWKMEAVEDDYNPEFVRRILRSNHSRKWKRRAVMFYLIRTGYHSRICRFRSW
jgi:hypothetical protein